MMTPQEIEVLVYRAVDDRVKEQLKPVNSQMGELQDEMGEQTKTLTEIKNLLQQFKGASYLAKLVFLGVAPLLAVVVWVRTHVSF